MVAIGLLLIAITVFATVFYGGEERYLNRDGYCGYLYSAVILPQIANQLGWFTAEMGRQPWVVYGHLRTSDALSESVVRPGNVLIDIVHRNLFAIASCSSFTLLNKKIRTGPYDEDDSENRPY